MLPWPNSPACSGAAPWTRETRLADVAAVARAATADLDEPQPHREFLALVEQATRLEAYMKFADGSLLWTGHRRSVTAPARPCAWAATGSYRINSPPGPRLGARGMRWP